MKNKLVYLYVFFSTALWAQVEEFDMVSFKPPIGWKRETNSSAVSFVITNSKTGGWCRISVFKSMTGSGNSTTDYDHEWNGLVETSFPDAKKPNPQISHRDGWTIQEGSAPFTWQGQNCTALLYVYSGHGRVTSLTVTRNSQEYLSAIRTFVNSLTLHKPEVDTPVTQVTPVKQETVVVTPVAGNQGISKLITNFDDGWVAQPYADYVQVKKGAITVLLHYGIELTDEIRNQPSIEDALFDRYVLPRYAVSTIRKYDNNGPCYFCIYFYEADAVDKKTGAQVYIGFRVITNNGISRCIEIISPSSSAFYKEFPNQEKVEAMLGYNKFAVTLADLVGEWQESSGASVNLYNTVTGAYAGMNTATSSHIFELAGDGTYASRHVGAHGMVGSMTTFDQKYKGKFTVSDWEMSMTNRFQGKTDTFWAQFEAVHGGRILHLTDKTYSGMHYRLVKTK